MPFQPISTFSIHNTLWQGVPQFKQVIPEEALAFYLFRTCLLLFLFMLLVFVL